jgi:hypothetical protein
MVGFVIESPLTHDNGSTTVFALIDHINEILLFILVHLFVIISRGDIDGMFCFGFRGFEGAGEEEEFGIFEDFHHLGVTDVFV